MTYRTLDDLTDVQGKRALVRVDLNAPMKDGRVTDMTRLDAVVPTLRDLADKGAKVALLAHFGRPKGERNPTMSLAPIAAPLAEAFGRPIAFAEDCVGPVAAAAVNGLSDGGVVLLENTRYHAGEEANDPAFIDALAALGDVYVNDAFSAAHRAHASTEGLARKLPAYAGRSMQKELDALGRALAKPERPVIAVVGGAKVSTKIDLICNLMQKVDQIVVGGGMANTFLYARGCGVGQSLCEKDRRGFVLDLAENATAAGCEIVLPVDIVCAREFKAGSEHVTVAADACPDDMMILDAGPQTVADLTRRFAAAKTVVWNGPLGAFELEPFDAATVAAAKAAGDLAKSGKLLAVAGGGDTVAALNHAGVAGDFSYVSTAGGAFLEWLEGKTLPGVAALEAAS